MKNKILILITSLLIFTSCNQEFFIPDNVKDALLKDSYNINDSLSFDYRINDSSIDTFTLIVAENSIETFSEHGFFGENIDQEIYSFKSESLDRKIFIGMEYFSMDNIFSAMIKLDDINFTMEIIEKEIDSISLNKLKYYNVFLLKSEYFENTHAYVSKDKGIIEIVNDSIKLVSIN